MQEKNPRLFVAFPHFFDHEALLSDFADLLKAGVFTNRGPLVERFEKSILEFLNDSNLNIVTCANGTLALEVALKAMGLKKGKVIVPSFTFVATVHSILNVGLDPVFCDIDPETLCLSPEAVEKALTPDVCAVLPVHVYGNVCDVEYFESLRSRGIKILYDAAHAFGTTWKGKPIVSWGDASVYSFHATKILNSGEGGAVVTRDPEMIKRIQLLCNFGIINELEVVEVGTNAKLSEVHALMGLHSLKQIDQAIQARAQVCFQYLQNLKDLPGLTFLSAQADVVNNFQYFPVFLNSKSMRDGLYDALREDKIFARKYFFPPVHQFDPYRTERFAKSLPITEDISSRVLCLPLHSALDKELVNFVSDKIRKFLTRK